MRLLLTCLPLLFFLACDTFRQADTDDDTNNAVVTEPTGLEGPAYDPSTSPVPMTSATRLPTPVGSAPAPTTASPGQPAAPQAYGGTPTTPG